MAGMVRRIGHTNWWVPQWSSHHQETWQRMLAHAFCCRNSPCLPRCWRLDIVFGK